QASGLSQISPDQFPERNKALFGSAPGQQFAYRFSGADFALRIQADQILPELSVSQVVDYHLGDNELVIDSDIELDIREAPLREHVGGSADAGFRLTLERAQSLTEIATAFFPRKTAGIQAAFRISEPAWQATLRVERLAQTVQVDGFHLFSIGEGIAYGSSVM